MSASDRLGTPGSGNDWQSIARAAAAPRDADDSELLRELLVFRLNGDPYALPVERVREIVRMRSITPMPRVPEEVRGVIALRGEVLQVVDLHRRLGLPPSDSTPRARIIVLHGDDGRMAGWLVDSVEEVLRVSEDAIRPTAPGESEAIAALCARGSEFVSLLDVERAMELDADG